MADWCTIDPVHFNPLSIIRIPAQRYGLQKLRRLLLETPVEKLVLGMREAVLHQRHVPVCMEISDVRIKTIESLLQLLPAFVIEGTTADCLDGFAPLHHFGPLVSVRAMCAGTICLGQLQDLPDVCGAVLGRKVAMAKTKIACLGAVA